jgi:hypothetical protein
VFYRYTQAGARIPVDLEGLYQDETLFLLGGSPTLKDLDLELLLQAGVVTMGMNNVPTVFKPSLWLCADKPQCFSPHIYTAPEIMKFNMISRRDLIVPGTQKRLRQCPSMFFFGARESGFTFNNFLDPAHDLVWWRSVFPMALQLAFRLGFRKVFLVGCGFHMPKEKGEQYAWNTELTKDQAQYSQNTYNRDLQRLKALKRTFDRGRFEVKSSTPGSKAHGILDYVPLERAVELALAGKPGAADTTRLWHSSEFTQRAKEAEAAAEKAKQEAVAV